MADTKPIPIRLSTDTIDRLEAAADRIGTTSAGVVRFCVETWLRHFEIKGVASLPINWDELLAEQDGRTKASRRFAQRRENEAMILNAAPNSKPPSSEIQILDAAEASVERERRERLLLPKADAPSAKASPPKRGTGRPRKRQPSPPAQAPVEPKGGK